MPASRVERPTPTTAGYFRDESGELTGRVAELARDVFDKVGKRKEFTPEEIRERGQNGMAHISERLTAAGLTTVHDAGADRAQVLAYEDAYRAGRLRHRAYMMIRGNDTISGLKAAGVYTGFGNEWIKVGGLKYAADGSASERTMRMSTPYVGTNDYGILTMTQKEIDEAVEDGHRHNFQVGIHANGDVTIDMVLGAYERTLKKWPDPEPPPSNRALHAREPGLAQADQGVRLHPDAVLDLRLLPRRKVGALRPRTNCGRCLPTARSWTAAFRCPAPPTTVRVRSSR